MSVDHKGSCALPPVLKFTDETVLGLLEERAPAKSPLNLLLSLDQPGGQLALGFLKLLSLSGGPGESSMEFALRLNFLFKPFSSESRSA